MDSAESRAPLAVFRTDAGAKIGGGHVFRCRALAAALEGAGWQCGLATVAETVDLFPKISKAFSDVAVVRENDAEAMSKRWPKGCDLLVVDHYGRDRRFETACRPWAQKVLVIDDLADRPHDCDWLLDGTIDRPPSAYDGLVPESCVFMMGTAFLPIRPEFWPCRRRILPRELPTEPWRVLISLGAMPDEALLLRLLEELASVPMELVIEIATGSAPSSPEFLSRAEAMDVGIHVASDRMAELIAEADLAIGAGGMSSWERSCLGLPAIMLVLAENQSANANAFARTGAARVIPDPGRNGAIANAVSEITSDPTLWQEMSIAASKLCDGLGLARIVERIGGPALSKIGQPVRLRPAVAEDALRILEWQSDPSSRRFSRSPSAPKREEHLAWFDAKCADANCVFNIILHGEEPAGILRLDKMEDPDAFEVSILIAPAQRRQGVSGLALGLARKLVPDVALWAYVKPENEASLALFAAAGYEDSERADWYVNGPCKDLAHV